MVAATVLMACAGCSGGDPAAAPDETASTPTSSPSASADTPTAAPSPGDMSTPGTTSGKLSQRSFPTPKALGADWSYAVDPGDAEEGYLGNGTPALARNPAELVQAAVPLGCRRDVRMPAPQHALEVDYGYRSTKVIAVRMTFVDAAQATGFYGGRNANLLDCHGVSGGPAIGVLVREVTSIGEHAVLSDRTPDSDPWTELAVLDGTDVVLLAAQTPPGRPPLTPRARRRPRRPVPPLTSPRKDRP